MHDRPVSAVPIPCLKSFWWEPGRHLPAGSSRPASPLRGALRALPGVHRGLTVLLETIRHLPPCALVTPVWFSLAGRSGCYRLFHILLPFCVPSPKVRLPCAAGVNIVRVNERCFPVPLPS